MAGDALDPLPAQVTHELVLEVAPDLAVIGNADDEEFLELSSLEIGVLPAVDELVTLLPRQRGGAD